jgi:hypothetical protein
VEECIVIGCYLTNNAFVLDCQGYISIKMTQSIHFHPPSIIRARKDLKNDMEQTRIDTSIGMIDPWTTRSIPTNYDQSMNTHNLSRMLELVFPNVYFKSVNVFLGLWIMFG